ncbi:MAG TPA: hypothetical protein VM099_16720, partial [Gemmatimonadaceae bacterium]|nr:hypothetical protein [Gemmatimonadaceae bacterium]
VSNHFSGIYGSPYKSVLLLVICAAGAAVRHVLNLRWSYPNWKPALAGVIVVSVIALHIITHFGNNPERVARAAVISGPVSFADARHVIDRRCAACHSAHPSDLTFGIAPAGVMFDTPEQIVARAARIRERAYVTRTMPPANKTHITDEERDILGRWAASPMKQP